MSDLRLRACDNRRAGPGAAFAALPRVFAARAGEATAVKVHPAPRRDPARAKPSIQPSNRQPSNCHTMSSVTTKTSPFKDIPSGAFAKWRNFSEQRASYAGKKELTQGPTPFDRKFDLTPGSPSEPHEFLGKLRWLARFLPQDKAAAPKKQAPAAGAKEETVRQKAR